MTAEEKYQLAQTLLNEAKKELPKALKSDWYDASSEMQGRLVAAYMLGNLNGASRGRQEIVDKIKESFKGF